MLNYYILKIISIVINLNYGDNMKFKNTLLIFSFLIIFLILISSVSAMDEDIINENNLTQDLQILDNIYSEESSNSELCSSNNEDVLSDVQTIVVDEIEENHNEMGASGTIQKAINDANPGDTIIINGRSYVHCHFVVNKKLTIMSNVGTTMEVCPSNSAGSNHYGIFFISPEASGTIIEGFTLNTNVLGSDDYGILVSGASNVVIKNCNVSNTGYSDAVRIENSKNTIIQNVVASDAENAIRIKSSESTTVKNSIFKNSNYGIYDVDSTRTVITSNNVENNKIAGIGVAGTSNSPTISFNNVTVNKNGFELTSSDNINILSNYIASNKNYGIFIDCEVKQLNVIGNFFFKNYNGETYFTQNVLVEGGEKLEVINNNYMIGVFERPVDGSKGGGYLGYTFELNENVNCPKIYATYGVLWTSVNYELRLSNITQSKKGIYSISIVDANGNVAKGLSSVPATFYLNKNNDDVAPQEGDVYKTVMMVDGTATVRFYPQDFKESGNVVTAVLPGTGDYLTSDQNKNVRTFNVDDKYIPGNVSASKIIISDLSTYPNSNVDYLITLKDINNNPIANEPILVNINSKNIQLKTDANGQATIKINENAGVYTIQVNYAGDDVDWAATSAQAKITVSKSSTKIVASNYAMFIKKTGYYQFALKDANGNAIANQKIKVKVNKKTYTVKTNSKGVAKLKLKLKRGTYKIKITYNGNNFYEASKATKKITVKKTLKTKLTAPKVTIAPKTTYKYKVVLKDQNGKALKKQKVTIKLNGKKYTKKTNSKGTVTIKVKFSKIKSYKVKATFKGTKKYKKSSATGKITVKKASAAVQSPTNPTPSDNVKPVEEQITKTQLTSFDRSFSLNSSEDYIISLKDSNGNALTNQMITYSLDAQTFSQNTDANGQVKVNISSLGVGSHKIDANFAKTNNYDASSSSSTINILNKTGMTFIDEGLPSDEIQSILDKTDNPVEFLSDTYNDVSLNINKSLNITFQENTTLNGKANSPVLTISVSDFNISNLIINANEGAGIVVENADNIIISNNTISNTLDSSKMSKYNTGELTIPGNGICLINSNNVKLIKNDVKSFGNAIFAQDSEDVEITNNTLSLSNYGITYGLGVKNTNISNNLITKNIGLYVMDVPEGPLGYGIFLNQSAVNVSITYNKILDNYMGISVDANYSTGIVILSNWISDNALEGIRFNAGYDLAENAVEPNVNDNAIYRNARGPSMMILGELSANPNGIYHYGEFNDTERLQLGTNWYGKNARITWDFETNTTGYGTMCPRIATTYISVKEIESISPGTYQVKFYKNDTIADKLPLFDMYATLNDNVEVKFNVINGVGTFSFDSGYNMGNNTIKVSIGSLKDKYRTFEVLLNKTIETTEIPA